MTDRTTRLDDLFAGSSADPDETVVTGTRTPSADPASAGAGAGERATTDPAPDGDPDDDLFDDDALLAPPRTSRLTIVLVALLILVVGFLLGVQVERFLGR